MYKILFMGILTRATRYCLKQKQKLVKGFAERYTVGEFFFWVPGMGLEKKVSP